MFLKIISLIFLTLFSSSAALAESNPAPPSFNKGGQEGFSDEHRREVMVITVNGVINPVSAEYIGKNIRKANEKNFEALIIELDTPGGLDSSMRNTVKDIIGSDVPVVVFVSPSGSRAASAGVFITMAAHIAAMAPGTNIGAAHPVGIGGKIDKTMAEKATNDAAAYIKSLAERRGRNAKWSEDAVRKSISATESEALKEHVIDLISKDINSLLSDINGRKVQTILGEKVLNTKNAVVVREEMGLRYKILDHISDPNIAYILMLLGFYGLFFELTNPGSIFPGVLGGISLILAFYAFQTLPVNYAGLLLIILAIILFILEVKITSHGILTIGGIIAMIIGSLMLFESSSPFMKLSLYVILAAVFFISFFFILTIRLAYKAHKRTPVTGSEGLVGLEGIVTKDITKNGGMVSLHGELWSAYSEEPISKGEKIIVENVSGLKVKVKKL
jgi:membrane-bound serine protease (ClpP class)